ncbi:hypothetical protein ROHU_013414 [Labeo rohita]|uniref:Uncharacterized protein n=1 Tax=Labeo rohita TaxID=84645 RepID=A0A498LDJ4_LABRO|nr:hypothetical protein ROHU_013414 [Labeo rohita]
MSQRKSSDVVVPEEVGDDVLEEYESTNTLSGMRRFLLGHITETWVGTNMVEYLLQSKPFPSVLALGDPQQYASQAFVILAGQALPQSTLLRAVDVCFKIAQDFQVLHGEAAPKLFETWIPEYAEKVLYLAKQDNKLPSLSVEDMTLGGSRSL